MIVKIARLSDRMSERVRTPSESVQARAPPAQSSIGEVRRGPRGSLRLWLSEGAVEAPSDLDQRVVVEILGGGLEGDEVVLQRAGEHLGQALHRPAFGVVHARH